MSRFLVDTDVCVDFIRRLPEAVEFFDSARTGSLAMSVVTDMELVVGCQNRWDRRKLDAFATRLSLLPLTAHDSVLARQLLRRHRPETGIGMADSLIAATALNRGLSLLTRNLKHYKGIKGLDAVAPYQLRD
ncbi:MAG: type II toxin-antitoxin system VapC family toxin [Candidatus Wallbacteria bacterium]|nr:type II toxin-antitoxin system VapC family toxin [Candidatus Wallbacteria bacterium]